MTSPATITPTPTPNITITPRNDRSAHRGHVVTVRYGERGRTRAGVQET
jgi:hypothetical protein